MTVAGDASYLSGVHLRHAALERNKRCLLAYLYNRLKKIRQMRWEFGIVLPPEIRANLCEPEVQWFVNYNKSLATYMKSIADSGGLNLTQFMQPPKSLYVEVQWFVNYNKSLATYMKSIADSGGLNLTQFMQPPKSLYVEVRCLEDYGKLQLEDGEIVLLKKNTQHLLPRTQCETPYSTGDPRTYYILILMFTIDRLSPRRVICVIPIK
uniref:DNA replication complex GINS protein PSF1 n=1 Tax=Timema californicum TaxID=61474 RepID=A0A7R9J877_TIMCA|nr:unnamed protein product [Timema californicum]